MRYWEIKEAAVQKIVAVMPGGFHPFHPGHKSLYDWAVKTFDKENVYVAATDDTKSRPFPFDVKQKLAGMAGVPADRFIQVKSPFNALSYENIIGDPAKTSLIFIRSEKDKSSHPLPDQIRKRDGMLGYIISFKDENQLQPAEAHAHMAYGPTIDFNFAGMDINSATELRNTWPSMSEEEKHKAAELMYGSGHNEAVKLLDQALGNTEESIVENLTSADIPVVQYDRKYGGDIEKVLAVKRNAKADAEALYKKLGGVSDANYEIISKAAEQKKQELRQVYRDALAKKGIKGAAALKSPEYLLFRKQNADLQIMLGTAMKMSGNGSGKIIKPDGKIIKPGESIEEVEVTPGQSLPKQIKVSKMPTPPQAPTGPDGKGEDGTRIGTTPKGNRSVASGAGTYIFTPKGKLILYMTPKIGGLQQTHNLQKQTVTVNFGTSAQGATIDQKATYDMSGKLISGDNTSIRSGNVGASIDKDKGATVDYKVDANTKVSANSKTGIKVN